jgi:hypothetical protein
METQGEDTMGDIASLQGLNEEQIRAAMGRFRARVAAGTLSPAVAGVTRIKGLNATGDVEVCFPRVDLSRLDELADDEQIAVAQAERIIAVARREGHAVVGVRAGDRASATRIDTFDPAVAPEEIIILNRVTGG